MGRKVNVYGYKIGDYPAWAGWARKLLGERDMTRAISTGNVRRGFESLQAMAARQVAEARAARVVIEPQEQPQDDPQEALPSVPGVNAVITADITPLTRLNQSLWFSLPVPPP